MSSEFPEKFAMYFSTMNSLSSKIFSEVQLIDSSINDGKSNALSYDERCARVDKSLIYDVLHPQKQWKKENQKKNKKSVIEEVREKTKHLEAVVVFNDECLDQPQTDFMLRFVYPRKPEKYVFDDTGCWIDEHSEPFAYCKQSQAKCCKLEEFAKRLQVDDKVIDLNRNSDNLRICEKTISTPQLQGKNEELKLQQPRRDMKKKSKAPYFGVDVMGGFTKNSSESLKEKDVHRLVNEDESKSTIIQPQEQTSSDQEDLNLTKQKQNLDLIAELQAKLNKTKMAKNMTSPPPPPPHQNTSNETQQQVTHQSNFIPPMSPTTIGKISKPKAPPPPPPPQKIVEDKNFKALNLEKENLLEANSKIMAEDTLKEETTKEEFLVDFSSPCRIATPKTGFDFLDNW